MKLTALLVLSLIAAFPAAKAASDRISGSYLEVRSCDVYTGPCFANAEMGLTGKEGMLVWSIDHGTFGGTALDGLKVIAVVHTDGTLGDLHYQPRQGNAVLIVDARANALQRDALVRFAQSRAGDLVHHVVSVKALPITADLATCAKGGCAEVKAGNLVEISTRCMGGKDHICGNESTFYPPLTAVKGAMPAFTELAAFHGPGLGLTWQYTEQRSAFLGSF